MVTLKYPKMPKNSENGIDFENVVCNKSTQRRKDRSAMWSTKPFEISLCKHSNSVLDT